MCIYICARVFHVRIFINKKIGKKLKKKTPIFLQCAKGMFLFTCTQAQQQASMYVCVSKKCMFVCGIYQSRDNRMIDMQSILYINFSLRLISVADPLSVCYSFCCSFNVVVIPFVSAISYRNIFPHLRWHNST